MDMAERYGSDLRRLLASAERLSESAIARGLRLVKTPLSRSSASLVCITRLDHREVFLAGARVALPVWLLPERGRRETLVAMPKEFCGAGRVPRMSLRVRKARTDCRPGA
jgi:hypothetical protein